MRKIPLGIFILLAGCMVGPKYHAPQTSMPDQFVEAKEGTIAVSDNDLCQWWKQFKDPLLDTLIAEAVKTNFDFQIALEKIVQARAQLRVEGSYLWPEFDVNAVATRTRNSQNFFTQNNTTIPGAPGPNSLLPTYQNLFTVGFDAIWELDFWGKFRHAKKAAFYEWEAAKEDAQDVMISIISEVARDYIAIRALQQKVAILEKKVLADEEQVLLTKDLFQSGLDSEIQMDNLIAALESDMAEIPLLETSLKQTIYALAVLLGRQPESLASEFNSSKPIPSGFDKVPLGLPSDLLRRRPDIKRAERELAAATEQIGVAVADLFPHISLTGNTFSGGSLLGGFYGYQSGKLNKLLKAPSRAWSIGPYVRWDLIDWGRTTGNIAIENSLQRQALLTYEKIVTISLKDVEGALVAYFEEQKRKMYLEDQVTANRRALILTEDLFQAGLASDLQVLAARKTLLDAENILIDSEQSLTSDLVALYKALGGNWECSYSP